MEALMESLFRTNQRHRAGDASTIEAECRRCHRPMVSRRRHAQLGRPTDKARHAARGLCTLCYEREMRSGREVATLKRAELLLDEAGLTMTPDGRIVSTTGHSGRDHHGKAGSAWGSNPTTTSGGPDQSARTPGRAVPRARLY